MSAVRVLARGLQRAGHWLGALQNGLAARYYALCLGGIGALLIYALIVQGD